jgi:branched-chain amino acid transport system permease protein
VDDASLAAPPARRAAAFRVSRRRGLPVALIAIAALAPFAFSAGGDVLNNLVLAAAYVMMALGLNIVVGFAGLLDLGYVAFYAIGAYCAAYFASGYWVDAGADGRGVAILAGDAAHLPGIHFNILLVLVIAALATTVAGASIGVPTLRLRGDYIAVVTLAFGEIIGRVAANGHAIGLFGGTLTAGPIGVGPIDKIDLPLLGPFDALDLRPWYWFALALVVLVLGFCVRLRDSRVGRAWIALRDDEAVAASAGIPIARMKLLAYATGAALGGVAGAFLATYLSVVNASQFEFSFSIFVLSMVVIGGLGSIPGAVAGAVALSFVNSYLLPRVLAPLPSRFGLDFDLSVIASGIYGAIVVLVVLLRPEGLVPARSGAGRLAAGERAWEG